MGAVTAGPADDAVRVVTSGTRVFVGSGAAVPGTLVEALARRALDDELADIEVCQILGLGAAPHAAPALAGRLRPNGFFLGANTRTAVAEGRGDFTPVFLSEVAGLLRSSLPIDVALVQVSPPDAHGFCSLGVSVDVVKPAVDAARVVVAEVNARMPRAHGDAFVHVARFAHVVSVDAPLPELEPEPFGEVPRRIAERVAALVPDGATLQLGIGAIPDAVLAALRSHRDLGVHTEMFSDGVVDLVERGVVTCAKKTLHRGKIVASFVLGTRRVYDFVDDNPFVEMRPSHYVNDPFVVAKNRAMFAVNSALAVDLTGQVCADSIGPRFWSGVGGQVDFVRGAARAEGGRSVIALPATARPRGRGDAPPLSRIVAELPLGAGVTTSRNDVHTVVTEHGVAELRGKTVRERVRALVAIADPTFRDDLLARARANGWL